jgi:ABC-type nitrate/sulfonate/bicarbonate transport system substrate-binding protein
MAFSKMVYLGIGIGAVIAVALAAAAIAMMQTAPAPAAETKPTSTQLDDVSLRLKWLNQAANAGFYTADKKGIYEKYGIKLTINAGGLDHPAIQMVLAGEEFGIADPPQMLIAREKGVPIVALSVIYRENPWVMFSLKESGIEEAKDFIGRKIGVKYGGHGELLFRTTMMNAGVDTDNCLTACKLFTEVPARFDFTPLLAGGYEVYPGLVVDEKILVETAGYQVNVIWPQDYGVDYYGHTLFTTEALIQENPDLVKRFVMASMEGWDYAIKHPEEAINYTLMSCDGCNREHETKMFNASLPLWMPDNRPMGIMDRDNWQRSQELLLKYGDLNAPQDLDKVYTNEFLPK